jgi:multidrug efflux pump subunit AcrB
MRTDIFPEIDIPVINVIWTYKGMDSGELERRITTYSEYAYTSNVNEIKRVESQTLNGVAVIKIYFHQGVDIGTALSQVTSASQSIRTYAAGRAAADHYSFQRFQRADSTDRPQQRKRCRKRKCTTTGSTFSVRSSRPCRA